MVRLSSDTSGDTTHWFLFLFVCLLLLLLFFCCVTGISSEHAQVFRALVLIIIKIKNAIKEMKEQEARSQGLRSVSS